MSEKVSLPIELLPCPFCGGDEWRGPYGGGMQFWEMQCAGCGARSGLHETEEELRAAWNCRHPSEDQKQS